MAVEEAPRRKVSLPSPSAAQKKWATVIVALAIPVAGFLMRDALWGVLTQNLNVLGVAIFVVGLLILAVAIVMVKVTDEVSAGSVAALLVGIVVLLLGMVVWAGVWPVTVPPT